MMYEEPKNICGVCGAKFHSKPDLYRHWKYECRYGSDKNIKGLCHNCLASDVELVQERGQILCLNCFGKLHEGKSEENKEPPTVNDLKKKWEK